jgi:ABC-type uncharacterized transport system permease subunit
MLYRNWNDHRVFCKRRGRGKCGASAVTFPMLFLAGTFIPLEKMPDYLQTIAKFLPLLI